KIGLINSGFVNTNLQFINGELDIGSPRAIPIIQKIKESISSDQIVIFDAPPGNSCPVIETISGSDFCILVTEPTAFGLWDVRIAVKVVRELNIPFGIIINRTGISDQEQFLDDFCKEENIPILMKIPFEKKIAEDYSRGIPLVNSPVWKEKFLHLFNSCKELVNQ
ncbi:MAG: (4Fe-4S)-binding protein, partial [Candidatus Thorarchaeota archaeon]